MILLFYLCGRCGRTCSLEPPCPFLLTEERPLPRGPGQCASTEQVDMQVKNGLPGTRTDVQYGAVSLLDFALASDLRSYEMAATNNFSVSGLGLP